MGSQQRWDVWLGILETARKDVMLLFHNRAVWKVLLKMLSENRAVQHRQVVNDWLSRLYVTAQAVGIRRQRDRSRNPASLGHLLSELARNPTVFDRDRFFATNRSPQFDERLWLEHADPAGRHLNPEIPQKDLKLLDDTCAAVKTYVDKYLAHRDPHAASQSSAIAFDDLNKSLDVLGGVLRRYVGLMTNTHLAFIGPITNWAWLDMFSTPWLPPDFMPPSDDDLLDAPPLPEVEL